MISNLSTVENEDERKEMARLTEVAERIVAMTRVSKN